MATHDERTIVEDPGQGVIVSVIFPRKKTSPGQRHPPAIRPWNAIDSAMGDATLDAAASAVNVTNHTGSQWPLNLKQLLVRGRKPSKSQPVRATIINQRHL